MSEAHERSATSNRDVRQQQDRGGSEFLTFQWHGDTFDLPDDAELLASSPLYRNQAFRWGRNAYGVQFHLEVSAEIAKEWGEVPAYAEALEAMLGPGSLPRVIEDLAQRARELRTQGRQIFERWLDVASKSTPAR